MPFHYWTPDAYQGSPTPVTGYLSVGPKVAAFALLLRLFVDAFGPIAKDWWGIIAVLAVLTMTLGNLAALGQDNIKRMLAYSSIAHTGYIMVGVAVYGGATNPDVQADAIQAVLFYLIGVLVHEPGRLRLRHRAPAAAGRDEPDLDVRGPGPAGADAGPRADPVHAVARRHPAARRLLGQGADHHLHGGGAATGSSLLAVIMMLNATAAAFYYLRVVVTMYMREAPEGAKAISIGGWTRVGLVLAAVGVVAIGLLPAVTQSMLDWTMEAARSLIAAA